MVFFVPAEKDGLFKNVSDFEKTLIVVSEEKRKSIVFSEYADYNYL